MFGVFEWIDFLELAEDLAARHDNEAAARTAISRAYYAAFHAGRDYLARVGIPLDRSRNAHSQVRHVLREQSAQIGQDLYQLHFWRKRADYDSPRLLDVTEQANTAVTVTRQTIEAIQAIP